MDDDKIGKRKKREDQHKKFPEDVVS